MTRATFSRGGEAGNQIVELKDKTDVPASERRQRCFVSGGQFGIPVEDLTTRRHVQPAKNVQQRRFARSRWPEQDDELPLAQREIDLAQRVNLDFTHAVHL